VRARRGAGKDAKHQFSLPIRASEEQGKLLPEVQRPHCGAGSADRKVESYNFRLILSDDPNNQVPSPSRRLRRARYELLPGCSPHAGSRPPAGPEDFANIVPIPNRKADCNNNGPFSTDYLGASWKSGCVLRERAAIQQAHVAYTQDSSGSWRTIPACRSRCKAR